MLIILGFFPWLLHFQLFPLSYVFLTINVSENDFHIPEIYLLYVQMATTNSNI